MHGQLDAEKWAQQLYETLRNDPTDERASKLHLKRRLCLQLLYDLVDAWEGSPHPDEFEEQIGHFSSLASSTYIIRNLGHGTCPSVLSVASSHIPFVWYALVLPTSLGGPSPAIKQFGTTPIRALGSSVG
ncbi:hypothetical protein ACA910_017843 [Epithemia clementina (nom. ined.)]